MQQDATTENLAPAATKALIGRLYRSHIKYHLSKLSFAAGCMAVVAAATAANAWMMEPVLDKVFLERNETMLLMVPLAVLSIAAFKGIAGYLQGYIMAAIGQRIIADVQIHLFKHLMMSDLSFFQRTTSGSLVSSFLNDANLLRDAVSKALTGIAKDSLMLIFLVALMFYQDWRLALVTLVVFPLAIVPVKNLGKRVRKASTETQELTGRFSAILTETLQAVRHIKAYGMESYESERAKNAIEKRLLAIYKVVKTRAAASPIMETLGGVAVAAVIFYGGSRVISGVTTPGTFFSFVTALVMAYQPMKSLANLNTALQEGLSAAQRIFKVMDLEPKISERMGSPELNLIKGEITFEGVTFTYADGKPALKDINLSIAAGKRVALVGASGSGKSTLLNLIPRFYDVTSGRILIDGQDIRVVRLGSLRSKIGLVSQEITLFDDTVRANIAYGNRNASDKSIEAAASAAVASSFIQSMQKGYSEIVGEAGIRLSGGQRQRIAIARAMLKDPPILLLDEATSALDLDAERQVQEALFKLMEGRTTLIVAHRLSTVIDADVIHVLEKGRIVESGSHIDLIKRCGIYAGLYRSQNDISDQEENF